MAMSPISTWRKSVYIAKHTSTTTDNYGNQTKVYATPTAYTMNVQPLSDDARIEMFGANAKQMFRAVIVTTGLDIHEFDVAYLDGASPTGETVNGQNANFIVRRVMEQNIATTIFFESIQGP